MSQINSGLYPVINKVFSPCIYAFKERTRPICEKAAKLREINLGLLRSPSLEYIRIRIGIQNPNRPLNCSAVATPANRKEWRQ